MSETKLVFEDVSISPNGDITKTEQSRKAEISRNIKYLKKEKSEKNKKVMPLEALKANMAAVNELVKKTSEEFINYKLSYQLPNYPEGPLKEDRLEVMAWIPEETRQAIFALMKTGATIETACAIKQVTPTSMQYWISRGTKAANYYNAHGFVDMEEQKYYNFICAGMAALESYKHTMTANLYAHGFQDWNAHAFLLSRKFPKEFGKVTNTVQSESKFKSDLENKTKTVANDMKQYIDHIKTLQIEDYEVEKEEQS